MSYKNSRAHNFGYPLHRCCAFGAQPGTGAGPTRLAVGQLGAVCKNLFLDAYSGGLRQTATNALVLCQTLVRSSDSTSRKSDRRLDFIMV